MPIRDNKRITCWLYTIGVDAGKATIMANLKVQEPGPKYCHFNRHPDAGYDLNFFNGLLSEKLVLTHTRRGDRWAWEKLPGHNRNEALDCRDYANAGLKIINPDMDAIELWPATTPTSDPSGPPSNSSRQTSKPSRPH